MAAPTADLVRTAVSDDGTESYFEDQTVYTDPPLRNTLAVYLTAYKVDEDQVETALEVTAFDPEEATEFTVANGVDGWHKYYFSIIPRYEDDVEYVLYDLVWSEDEEAFYEYINETESTGSPVTDTDYWEVVEDPNTKIANVGTDSESGNLIYQIVQKVVTFQTSICNLKAASLYAKEECGCSGADDCGCGGRLGKYYTKIRNLFAVMYFNEAQQQYLEGEKNARLAKRYCDECGCLDR